MLDVGILGQVALGYSPFIDRNRAVTATRLTVFPLKPDASLDAAQLLHAVGGVWPADGPKVSLNVASESLLHDLLKAQPAPNVMIEMPGLHGQRPGQHRRHHRAACRTATCCCSRAGRCSELPREVLPCFKYSIIDLADDRRVDGAKAPRRRDAQHPARAGGRAHAWPTWSELRARRGGGAGLADRRRDRERRRQGAGSRPGRPDMQAIVELIHRVDAEEPIDKLEDTLKRDPTLAFKLMRYINSPAFGLRVEISSFRHAIMMLGYKRLKRWLALLLATASKDVNLKPVMFAAVRRGMLMEELVRSSGDEEMRNEMFICGVFSLLDRMFQQPFSELLDNIPVPPRVYQALAEEKGPFYPYINMVRAIENESLFDFRECADALMVSVSEVNRAELRALTAASQLE